MVFAPFVCFMQDLSLEDQFKINHSFVQFFNLVHDGVKERYWLFMRLNILGVENEVLGNHTDQKAMNEFLVLYNSRSKIVVTCEKALAYYLFT